MIKTIELTAGEEMAVELAGGVHARIENRGTGIVYASKSDNVTAGEDGVVAVSSGGTKYLKNACSYANYEGNFGYKGTIYLKSSEDGIVEIETGDYFFDSVNKSEGGGGSSVDAYTKAEIDTFLAGKVGFADYAQSETAGVVKVSPTYGFYTETGNRTGMLKPKTASRENIESGTSSDIRFLTSGNASDLMSVYGIESKEDISTLKSQVSENGDTLGYSISKEPSKGSVNERLNYKLYTAGDSMVGLGFDKDSIVSVSDFFEKLIKKHGPRGLINVFRESSYAASIGDSSNSVKLNGGFLTFNSSSNNFPNSTWIQVVAYYMSFNDGNCYKITAKTDGVAGVVSSHIYKYEGSTLL